MLDQFEIRTEDMPSEMQSLLREYPRDAWDAHPGFSSTGSFGSELRSSNMLHPIA